MVLKTFRFHSDEGRQNASKTIWNFELDDDVQLAQFCNLENEIEISRLNFNGKESSERRNNLVYYTYAAQDIGMRITILDPSSNLYFSTGNSFPLEATDDVIIKKLHHMVISEPASCMKKSLIIQIDDANGNCPANPVFNQWEIIFKLRSK
ncbi:MAG: hypothetical protein KAS12_04195 [Candidatus Aenigmarchaeota archaeon]|nr:hypothetical protein [Candidatus Aenigmarchaeota archaeon]